MITLICHQTLPCGVSGNLFHAPGSAGDKTGAANAEIGYFFEHPIITRPAVP
jgi:hypothetical protein